MLNLLKTHFGYDQFRPLQEEIIHTVLAGKDALVLMPTGGGKSLCYQLPALKFEGLTLVISPLIALMKDQVDALQANGIAAEYINSTLTPQEVRDAGERARRGKIKLLYLAPERLAIPAFRNFLQELKVSLIAIDEAHCISEWGHDFRPEYRNLKILQQDFPRVPLIALTATATPKVREDIIEQLNLGSAKKFISSFNRANLTYLVQPKRNSFNKLLALLEKHRNEPAIIYCFSRKATEELAVDLANENFKVLPYHAGLDNAVRRQTQEKFIRDEVPIITATIAFGMGIDKPDIRLIVHFDLPKTLEGYYQETGRAGRDGLPSECVLFYSYGDKMKQDFFINQIEEEGERAKARKKLEEVINFCELQSCRRKFLLEYFGEKVIEENCQGCDVCFAPKEEFDATEITQKILSAIIRTGGRFGANYITQVLLGSGNKKISERGHQNLSVFGIVNDFNENELKQIIRSLLNKKFLKKEGDEYPVLRVSGEGLNFLKQGQKIILPRPKADVEIYKTRAVQEIEYDPALFEKLRTLRKQIADRKGVPPFVIFGNVSLQEMAFYLPQSLESFSRISGVGAEKLRQFGEEFLALIGGYARENNLKEKPIPRRRSAKSRAIKRRGSTYDETKKLFLQKLPLAEIAKHRGLAEETIIGHLEKIITAGEELDVEYLKPSEERFAKIKQAFLKSGAPNLSPVREILGEEFSYKELRLARIFLK